MRSLVALRFRIIRHRVPLLIAAALLWVLAFSYVAISSRHAHQDSQDAGLGASWRSRLSAAIRFRSAAADDRFRAGAGGSSHNDGADASGMGIAQPLDQTGPVDVMICSDQRTLGGMVTLINSILQNTNTPVRFHLVTDVDTVDHLKAWLGKYFSEPALDVRYILFDGSRVEGKINVRGARQELASALNYARYYLPELLPSGFNGRLVYIDDDAIVQGDIVELRNVHMAPTHVAAFSPDCNSTDNSYGNFLNFDSDVVKDLGIDPKECSFNAGVFVADLRKWKQNQVTEKLEHFLVMNTQVNIYGGGMGGGGSQPPMMIVFYRQYSPIPDEWHTRHMGWFISNYYKDKKVKRAKLLHWNGKWKPWGEIGKWIYTWEKYFLKDPWQDWKVKRRVVKVVKVVQKEVTT